MEVRFHFFRTLTGCLSLVLAALLPATTTAQKDVRARIDGERGNMAFTDIKTLEKARSFIRLDSTYYLGYFLEGGYMFFRANDKLGFTKAIVPLKKALQLIEKDYDRPLRTRSNNYRVYSEVYRYKADYGFLTYLLESCYQNVEMPDKAMDVLYHLRNRNFQVEMAGSAYNTMAWIYHRNRVYTSKQFPFLKNSVRENVATANRYLDSALLKLYNDAPMNNGLYDPNFLNRQYLSTYHYKAMIADYKLEVDSANLYYNELLRNGAYSSNNYAEFKLAMAELETANKFFVEAERREASVELKTKEYYYMRGTLDIYRGHPEQADTLLRKVLQQQGATPGFGWHSIGLARALHYEGLSDESQERTNKASNFQELHIGTTWGQEQYNLAVASLNYLNQLQFEKEYFFENDQWWFWFNPVNWYEWIRYALEIHHYKMVLASLIAENPERNQVIYTVFSSENLMSFDEVESAIDGFGNEYFIKIYKNLLNDDKRPNLKKYFCYFLGKLYLAEGNKTEATAYFKQVLDYKTIENEYQTMLRARVYEGLALASGNREERQNWTRKFYETFPQLVPFSDLKMEFQLVAGGATSGMAKDVLDDLKNCTIDFKGGNDTDRVSIDFSETTLGMEINYSVLAADGSKTLQQGTLHVPKKEANDAGKLLAYRLFGINKKLASEKPEVVKVPV